MLTVMNVLHKCLLKYCSLFGVNYNNCHHVPFPKAEYPINAHEIIFLYRISSILARGNVFSLKRLTRKKNEKLTH